MCTKLHAQACKNDPLYADQQATFSPSRKILYAMLDCGTNSLPIALILETVCFSRLPILKAVSR